MPTLKVTFDLELRGNTDGVSSNGNSCIVKSDFQHEGDLCIANPAHCTDGISVSIWERVVYKEDVLNVYKEHDKKYIFSTGEFS